jgi:hypothetical protein
MKFAVAFAVAALGATSVAAYAQQTHQVMIRHHGGPMMDMDANHDGWLTRAEAAAGADRMFEHMDSNHDGRLTEADHAQMLEHFNMRTGGPEGMAAPDDGNCTRTVEPAPGGHGQRVTVICNGEDDADAGGNRVERRVIVRHGDHAAPHAESGQHVEREVTVITRDGDEDDDMAAPEAPGTPAPPHAAHAPRAPMAGHHPPMFMMLMANSDESDTNHDGALSRDEFRAQHLRFFDASDANRDGRIRFEPPPELPVPPTPPAAPEAPTPPPPPR